VKISGITLKGCGIVFIDFLINVLARPWVTKEKRKFQKCPMRD